MKEKRKRMRLTNGFGQISEIKGRRLRKPFRAMVTVGKTDEGKPIVKLLKPEAYFRTYNEAYEALVLYHRNPTDQTHSYTMDEVFNMWYEEYKKKGRCEKVEKKALTYWNDVSILHNKKIALVKTLDLKEAIENAEVKSDSVRNRIKIVLNQMYDYAVMCEYVDKNYARLLKLSTEMKRKADTPHLAYTPEEMATFWKNKDDNLVKSILIQCYMGWRPQELLNIKLSDINELNETIIGGSKTEAGRDRVVPISKKIRPLVFELIKESKETSNSGKLFYFIGSYEGYYKKVKRLYEELNINPSHRPHDGRKTFVTMAKKKGVEDFAIKRIIGHVISDLTENVYTERDIEWLRAEIEKV